MSQRCLASALDKDPQGWSERAGRRSPSCHPALRDTGQGSRSAQGQEAEPSRMCWWLQGFHSPVWAVVSTPPPTFPAHTLPPLPLGESQGHPSLYRSIWGQAARNDAGHTSAFFLWFFPDIRRGLKNFPQGRGSPQGVGSAPGPLPERQVGCREERRWHLKMRRDAAREGPGPEEASSLPTPEPSRQPSQPHGLQDHSSRRTITILCRGQKCQHRAQAHA